MKKEKLGQKLFHSRLQKLKAVHLRRFKLEKLGVQILEDIRQRGGDENREKSRTS